PGSDGEVFNAGVAAVVAAAPSRDAVAFAADRTDDAVRPQARLQIQPRRFRIRYRVEKLKNGDCCVLSHARLSSEVCTKSTSDRRGSQVYSSPFMGSGS